MQTLKKLQLGGYCQSVPYNLDLNTNNRKKTSFEKVNNGGGQLNLNENLQKGPYLSYVSIRHGTMT